jgi:hypothetical protein
MFKELWLTYLLTYYQCDMSKTLLFYTLRTGRATSPKKLFAPEISIRFLCAHASSYDCMSFVFTCLHVACTNKNLGNERLTTFLTHASSWSVRTFLKQDGVSNDPETFSYVISEDIWTCVRAHETSQIALQRELCWTLHRTAVLAVSRTPMYMTVLGVLETAVFVC